jgi:Cu/Ag efflux protein CusF
MRYPCAKTLVLAFVALVAVTALAVAAEVEEQHMPRAATVAIAPDSHALQARVEKVDAATGLLRLRATDGETVELAAPKALLEHLQIGDRVEVVIRRQAASQPRDAPGL